MHRLKPVSMMPGYIWSATQSTMTSIASSVDRIDAGSLANLSRHIMLSLILCPESSRPFRIALGPRSLSYLCLLQRWFIHVYEDK
jgi:hypothetical protein